MSAVSYDRRVPRLAATQAGRWRRIVIELWRRARPIILIALPAVFLVVAVVLTILAVRTNMLNRSIAALRHGQDVAVAVDARPELLLARVQFLLNRERVDEAQPYVEVLDRSGSDQMRAIAHYNFGNARLRQAFDELTATHVDKAGPFVVLARQEYRRALTLNPEAWDTKFNLDVASRLVRDFPSFERTMGDEVKAKKKLWTDVPGKPEGLP